MPTYELCLPIPLVWSDQVQWALSTHENTFPFAPLPGSHQAPQVTSQPWGIICHRKNALFFFSLFSVADPGQCFISHQPVFNALKGSFSQHEPASSPGPISAHQSTLCGPDPGYPAAVLTAQPRQPTAAHTWVSSTDGEWGM